MPDPHTELAFSVEKARLQFVLRGQPVSLASTFLLAATTVAVMWSSVAHTLLLGWASAFAIVTALRAVLWASTRSSYFHARPIQFWRALFVAGCGLSGASWGIASVIFQSSDPALSTFMAVIIAGTAAGSITSLASDRWAAYAFVLPCLLPFTVQQLVSENRVDVAIGIVTVLFLATISGSVNRFHAQLTMMMTARAELQASQDSVNALNERMKLATSAAKVGIYEWNVLTQETTWDAQVYALWDLDPQQNPPSLAAWRSRIHADDLSQANARFGEILRKEREFDMEFRVVSRSGVIRDVRSRGFVQRNAEGEIARMVGLVMDVTDLRRLDRMQQEFVSVVSHELRTPLTSIRGALGLLPGAADLTGEKARQLLDLANRNAERLALLIDDILDMDKIESGNMRFELASHDLNNLLAQALASNTVYAERLGVRLDLQPCQMPVAVCVDSNRFLQVMNNLLSNAAKFSPSGQCVEVFATVHDASVRVSVRDRGPGIPTEFHTKIFGKFCQSDSSDSRSKGGSGLGLAISKAIVEAMRGSIGFTTQAGEGTTFFFDLPMTTQVEQTPEQHKSTLVSIDLMTTDARLKASTRAAS